MQALLTVEELATYLHKSVASIRSDSTRNPQSLPPICRLPGTKRLLWRIEDVQAWIGQHVCCEAPAPAMQRPDLSPAPRRGRPTKAQQAAKQRASAAAAPSPAHQA